MSWFPLPAGRSPSDGGLGAFWDTTPLAHLISQRIKSACAPTTSTGMSHQSSLFHDSIKVADTVQTTVNESFLVCCVFIPTMLTRQSHLSRERFLCSEQTTEWDSPRNIGPKPPENILPFLQPIDFGRSPSLPGSLLFDYCQGTAVAASLTEIYVQRILPAS